jgi:hypothetical protein
LQRDRSARDGMVRDGGLIVRLSLYAVGRGGISMNDTDKLIAAIFAATMMAKESHSGPRDFFTYYDACVGEIREREAVATAEKVEQDIAAQKKAWG